MEDDPTKTALDGKLINLEQDHERLYWQNALGVSEVRLREAVGAVGNAAERVREYLASH